MTTQTFSELLDWQWSHYPENHRNRTNLLIHIVAVPLFWVGAINFVFPLVFLGLIHALGGAVLMALSLRWSKPRRCRSPACAITCAGCWPSNSSPSRAMC